MSAMTRSDVCVRGTLAILCVLATSGPVGAWGPAGHSIVARAALAASDELPSWFREAADAIADLADAPDRWRGEEGEVPALGALRPDHFFDLDLWGEERLPVDRWAYVERARLRRLRPEAIGFLPFAIQEQYGILLGALRDARGKRPGAQVAALVAAGTLAHLAGDASVPLHASRHHHGWIGPNPAGFTRLGEVHHWFESELVAGVEVAEVHVAPEARHIPRSVPAAVEAALADSLAQVPRLYELERRARVEHDDAGARALVRERLGAGATLLARLWRTAWVRSAT
jgi:hypothetical protein